MTIRKNLAKSLLILAFEISPIDKRVLEVNFTPKISLENLQLVISRLIGHLPGTPGVTKAFWDARGTADGNNCYLVQLKSANSCVALAIDTSALQISETKAIAAFSSKQLQNLLSSWGISPNKDKVIHPAVAYISTTNVGHKELPREWLVSEAEDKNFEFKSELALQLVQRVAIERSLYSWALRPSLRIKKLRRFFHAPYVAYRVRRWPVELMADQYDVIEKYSSLRDAFNLPSVRKSLLEQAKSWWTVATAVAAIIALLVSPLIDKFWDWLGVI